MIRTKFMSSKEYINLCVENARNICSTEASAASKTALEISTRSAFQESLLLRQSDRNSKQAAFIKFSESVKEILLSECINSLYKGALAFKVNDGNTATIGSSLINKFINENGAPELLRTFRTKTLLLSEYNRLVTKYHKLITEAVDRDNPDSFVIDTTVKDNFFDDLNMTAADDVILNIRTRVTDAVQDFIDSNISDKMDIKDIIQSVQDKVAAAKTDSVKEAFTMQGKRDITKLKSKPKKVFSAMVTSMVESVITTPDLKAYYSKGDKLDMDKIVENCELMYTFLEVVNTANIANVDDKYIKDVLTSLKA